MDTGANRSGLSPSAVSELGLYPVGWDDVIGPQGKKKDAAFYRVEMQLAVYPGGDPESMPEMHGSDRILAAELDSKLILPDEENLDVLIGMDLLEEFHLCVGRGGFVLRAI